MKILLLNQAFYPDVVATAQYLTDLAVALAERGHDVTVVASRRAYDDPSRRFQKTELWRGVKIHRIATTAFGKHAKWRRAADFASFMGSCLGRLLVTQRPDVVVALTSPPLISCLGAVYARWRGARFFYWVMDLNPDEALAAGWLREGSLPARVLHRLSRYSFRHAHKIIALDQFMGARIKGKGIAPEKIAVLSPWSHDDAVRFDAAGREKFRRTHGLTDKFVIMYSGNHSPCHPLDTLLAAAKSLRDDPRFGFLFVGGGSGFRKIQDLAAAEWNENIQHSTSNIQHPITGDAQRANIFCLPYQPLAELSASLSAADLHVVVMGDAFVGTIHPCKIYNVLGVGAPIVYIGPRPSHLSEVLDAVDSKVCGMVAHGDVAHCVAEIRRLAGQNRRGEADRYAAVARGFSQAVLLPRLIAELEHEA